jgi:hypothetical protein
MAIPINDASLRGDISRFHGKHRREYRGARPEGCDVIGRQPLTWVPFFLVEGGSRDRISRLSRINDARRLRSSIASVVKPP